jgi:hypothetical protein
MVTTHAAVPEHPPPDHPANLDPGAGAGVSVIGTPWPTVAEHVPGHHNPPGSLVTLPEPLPPTDSLSVCQAAGGSAATRKSATLVGGTEALI